MTTQEAIEILKDENEKQGHFKDNSMYCVALVMAIKALEQGCIDKSAMMYDIYMEGVNMGGEYQGCWVRFSDIKKIVDKYIGNECK